MMPSNWENVDDASNPGIYLDYLDTSRGLDRLAAGKRETFRVLGLKKGHSVLDVGCGTGDDVLAMAEIVGSSGRSVGVDISEAMIAEARKRVGKTQLAVEFQVGDVYNLPFANDTFDACRADRVFEHLHKPSVALAEMIRVTRPGAMVGVTEPDWGTLILDAPQPTTRRVLNHITDSFANGWCGRKLPRFFKEAELEDIIVVPWPILLTDFGVADHLCGLRSAVKALVEMNDLTAAQAEGWLAWLKEADEAGHFFCFVDGFGVAGRKPA